MRLSELRTRLADPVLDPACMTNVQSIRIYPSNWIVVMANTDGGDGGRKREEEALAEVRKLRAQLDACQSRVTTPAQP